MTEEIKQQIEMINRGEVPHGYKKTKVGIVPSDWENRPFSKLFSSTSAFTSDLEQYPLFSLTIEDGIVEKSNRYERSHLVKKDGDAYKIVNLNDFAYNPMNVRFGAVARHKKDKSVCVSGYYDIFTTKDKRDLNFMDNYLVSFPMIQYYNKVSTGSLIEKQRVHFSQFIEFELPLPKIEEREKIAEILTTCDNVIELKEKLIAEKHSQKKWLMQNLLTGKKRLKGFTGEWKKVKLGDIFKERVETNCVDLELLSITATRGVIPRTDIEGKDNSSEEKSKYKKINIGDIGYNTMRMWQGVSAYSNYCGIVSPAYTVLNPSHKIEAKFFTYLFKLPQTIFLFFRFSQGLVDDTRNLKYANFKEIKLLIPIDKKEQTDIGNIITAADIEIDVLQKDVTEWKNKKKALMQLLLTGKVRVSV